MKSEEHEAKRSHAATLRGMLQSPGLDFVMEAHNGLSARLAREAGFSGIWASGLSISTALGIRDSNEASWTQVLDVIEFMVDAGGLPVLVDGDTGYGNFNNARRFVRKLCERGAAGVAIEDKVFPKTNSFIGEGQPLAAVDEFCGKIQAAKDAQTDPDFCFVARTEGFIAGRPLAEVLDRAERYAEAGADGIFVHSKRTNADEIERFMQQWSHRVPIVIAPTTYAATPTTAFKEMGISLLIWANQSIRASTLAMSRVMRQIKHNESAHGLDNDIEPLANIFKLLDYDELATAEQRFLAVSAEWSATP